MSVNRNNRQISMALTELHAMNIASGDFSRGTDAHGEVRGFYVFNNNENTKVKLQCVPYDNPVNEIIELTYPANSSLPIVLREVKQKAGVSNIYWGN